MRALLGPSYMFNLLLWVTGGDRLCIQCKNMRCCCNNVFQCGIWTGEVWKQSCKGHSGPGACSQALTSTTHTSVSYVGPDHVEQSRTSGASTICPSVQTL